MNINISDEMIEKMVRDQVKARVNQYIADRTKQDPHWITELYRNCAVYEVCKVVTDEFARETCKELCKEQIAYKVVESFADKIASCFEYQVRLVFYSTQGRIVAEFNRAKEGALYR